ncbi:hypothetical protein [Brevundimonas mediterranea]|uniref:Uncharacterized protein n=2 Tax=Brevundimonas TaxID=41275 RepID=A0A7W6A3A0_9CAUL|nr:hypothetical protein [Brevundimonas mediterranea]MBB3871382.1 hypothetical protein [Brevundimonas mediterranea]
MAESHTPTFADLFAEWDNLRRFDGFLPDEFASYEACCAAERDYEARIGRCESLLLAHTPTSEREVAWLLEVINSGEGFTPQTLATLGRVQAWMMSRGMTAHTV